VGGNVRAATFGRFWNSRLDAGYTGANSGTGTFDNPSVLGSFRVTGKQAGFQNSYVIASTIKSVTLASITEDNDTRFGVIAGQALLRLTITAQRFTFDPTQPSPQTRPGWEFDAIDLTWP
jgi:hypothetical protein